ncbi:MAG TPA: glutamate synthase-related protein, partial [Solirubrobacteraceae bacterium]|nr:glutamate synthase-related protein [Solirubrobacteraceae bacterium]
IGCIQAQRCHVGNCPTGVATQSKWLMRGLAPELKSARAANYIRALRGELLSLSRSCGVRHPALMTPDHVEIVGEGYATIRLEDVFHYEPEWREISADRAREIDALIGPPAGVGEPGPEGGPIAGDEADTGEHEQELASARGGSGGAAGGD